MDISDSDTGIRYVNTRVATNAPSDHYMHSHWLFSLAHGHSEYLARIYWRACKKLTPFGHFPCAYLGQLAQDCGELREIIEGKHKNSHVHKAGDVVGYRSDQRRVADKRLEGMRIIKVWHGQAHASDTHSNVYSSLCIVRNLELCPTSWELLRRYKFGISN